MAEPTVAHLSIGEVLGLLLEEFPDVTISKIRFLESQGLIAPERTTSGYRKFYAADVELLRVILREQRERFLPLRVIKDRIDSGELEPSAESVAKHPAARTSTRRRATPSSSDGPQDGSRHPARSPRTPPQRATRGEPSGTSPASGASVDEAELAPTPAAMPRPTGEHPSGNRDAREGVESPRLMPGVLVSRSELCGMASVTPEQLDQLEEYGVVTPRHDGTLYGEDAVEVASAAGGLLRAGIDARHLRAWRTSAEREVGLFEQLIVPLLRQRNPRARGEATAQIDALSDLGGRLRAALMRAAVHRTLDL